MPAWDGELYLTFAVERTRPAEDLAARVAVEAQARVADLGCGPGNSTAVLARRWPAAALTGIDRSEAMLAFARTAHPQWTWIAGDISTWRAGEPFDVVFSNAALQWVPDHARQFPRLLTQVAPGGALAVQLPANLDAPAHVLMRDLAASPAWRDWFPETCTSSTTSTPSSTGIAERACGPGWRRCPMTSGVQRYATMNSLRNGRSTRPPGRGVKDAASRARYSDRAEARRHDGGITVVGPGL
jgi:trans-aconitate methyltransferase